MQPFEDTPENVKVMPKRPWDEQADQTVRMTPEQTHDLILGSALGAAEQARDGARTALGWLRIIEPEHEFTDLIKELDSLVYKIDQKIKDAGI